MKKIISVIIAVGIIFGSCICSFATSGVRVYVASYLDGELTTINNFNCETFESHIYDIIGYSNIYVPNGYEFKYAIDDSGTVYTNLDEVMTIAKTELIKVFWEKIPTPSLTIRMFVNTCGINSFVINEECGATHTIEEWINLADAYFYGIEETVFDYSTIYGNENAHFDIKDTLTLTEDTILIINYTVEI